MAILRKGSATGAGAGGARTTPLPPGAQNPRAATIDADKVGRGKTER
jgi:hypothetical protein